MVFIILRMWVKAIDNRQYFQIIYEKKYRGVLYVFRNTIREVLSLIGADSS